jgi:hypothetical protein
LPKRQRVFEIKQSKENPSGCSPRGAGSCSGKKVKKDGPFLAFLPPSSNNPKVLEGGKGEEAKIRRDKKKSLLEKKKGVRGFCLGKRLKPPALQPR